MDSSGPITEVFALLKKIGWWKRERALFRVDAVVPRESNDLARPGKRR